MMESRVQQQLKAEPNTWRYKLISGIIVVFLLLWSATSIEINQLETGGWSIARSIVRGLLNPNTELLFDFTSSGVAYLLLETIAIAYLGTVVGAILAVPLAFLSAVNIVPKSVAFVLRLFIMIIRTIPTFVYGLMFIRVTGPGAFAGLLTMALSSIGMITKLYVESIEELDKGIIESLDAAGCNGFEKVRYGILPQLFPTFLSTIIYRFDMNLRDATVLGLVGAGGIGAPLIFAMSAYRWNEVGAIIVGLILLILIVEYLSTKIRQKLVRG